jgi:DNA-binding transcriptional MerR regulator
MSQLAEASGVSAGTIKHYLREGLLPEPVRTSRNMAYYPPDFVERIRLIKQLQEDRCSTTTRSGRARSSSWRTGSSSRR